MDKKVREKYKLVIGLEVHVQLLTRTKIYSSDGAGFGDAPNTNVGVITLAHPGTLPKLNRKAAEMAMKMGLACHCEISRQQIFDRKNYFYPDLPKGYQLTQDRTPICLGGRVVIGQKRGEEKSIALHRIHIEEDAGKSIHDEHDTATLLDFNRAGVPLIEIVTMPCISSAEDACAVLAEIRQLVRYLGICDGNMEEGSLRCDANVSVMLHDATTLGKKVEVKNMNSIRHVQRAIEHETERQILHLETGTPVVSETRTFDADTGLTHAMRTKEELNDYRYFPDPDLSPMTVSEEWISAIRTSMPMLPRERRDRYIREFQLSDYDALVLTDTRDVAEYFEATCRSTLLYKAVANWVMGPVKSWLNETGKDAGQCPVMPVMLAELIQLVDQRVLSFSVASQQLFPELLISPGAGAKALAQKMNLVLDSDVDSLLQVVNAILKEFPLKVEEYKRGKKVITTMFMGEIMKRTKGKADPKLANELLIKRLSEI